MVLHTFTWCHNNCSWSFLFLYSTDSWQSNVVGSHNLTLIFATFTLPWNYIQCLIQIQLKRVYSVKFQFNTLFSWWAAANPAGPDPTTATFFPVLNDGGSGRIHPCSNAWSMMAHSMFFMVTGGSLIPSTHAPSHGAGHTLPVNSVQRNHKQDNEKF